jgi:hypothetical protein
LQSSDYQSVKKIIHLKWRAKMPLINQTAYEGRSATLTRAGVLKLGDIATNVPQATTTVAGKAALATQAQVNTGTNNTTIVTPLTLKTNLASPPAIGGTAPNSGAFTTLTTSGDYTASGNVIINAAGKQLRVHGGAVTDFIGTGTLASGTVTIANTNIASTDRIFTQRIAANGSTTLGMLSYTISAAASFTITSLIEGTPGSTQTADTSTFAYFIVRQV